MTHLRIRVLVLALAIGVALGLGSGTPATAGGVAGLVALPGWAWRPGHATLVRETVVDRRQVLEEMNVASGRVHELADLSGARALGPQHAVPARPIGRAARPDLVWSEDGRGLVVVARGDLVWLDLEADTPRRLTTTDAPISDIRVAPDGSAVAFARERDLWVVATSGDAPPRRLTRGGREVHRNAGLDWVYPEELGAETGAWWSPDARRIAWLRLDEQDVRQVPLLRTTPGGEMVELVRYPRAGETNPSPSVAVTDVESGETTRLDLGTPRPEYVARVTWFPDGRRVAVTVLDRAQRDLRLLECPIDGRAPTVVVEEHDEAWIDVPPDPRFLDDGRFLWRSERDGRRRWYLATIAPHGEPASLVPLSAADVDADAALRYDDRAGLLAYEAEVDRGLRRRPLVGPDGVPAPFAPGADLDARVALDASGRWALVRSSRTDRPPRLDLRDVEDGAVVRVLGDAAGPRFAAGALPRFETGIAPSGAPPLAWRLWRPADLDETTPHPLVVHVYGGPGARTVVDRWDAGEIDLVEALLERGFLVLEADGRGARGFGRANVRAVLGRLGIHELEDQVRAVEAVSSRAYVDAGRVGITGWSYGGTMTCLALTRRPDVFRAGVAFAPVTDWRLYDTIYTERYMGRPEDNQAGYAESAATRDAAKLSRPLLILHGVADDNVHVANVLAFVSAMGTKPCPNLETMVYPDVGHGLGRFYADAHARMLAFLVRHLAPAGPAAPAEPASPARPAKRGAAPDPAPLAPSAH